MKLDRDRWRTAVFNDKSIGNATRVLLLYFADHMAANGYVSVPVSTIRTALEIPATRITERVAEAKRAGLLDTIEKGCPGRTATYCATLAHGDRQARPRRQRPGGLVHSPITDVRNEPITDVGKSQLRTSHTRGVTDVRNESGAPDAQPITDVCGASTTELSPVAVDPSGSSNLKKTATNRGAETRDQDSAADQIGLEAMADPDVPRCRICNTADDLDADDLCVNCAMAECLA